MSLNYGLGKTNCLTYIPNDIKLSVSDGKLTLKAGSKVYVPNGFNEDGSKRFDEVIVPSDKGCGPHLYNNSNLIAAYLPSFGSLNTSGGNPTHEGTTLPGASASGYTYSFFYNTSENKCYHSTTSGDTFIWVESSLPIGIVTRTAEVGYTTINQIFNGIGYIGSTIFALPGVKLLSSNGWNEDGTYKNEYIEIKKVLTRTMPYAVNNGYIYLYENNIGLDASNQYIIAEDSLPTPASHYELCWLKKENRYYYHNANSTNWILYPSTGLRRIGVATADTTTFNISSLSLDTIPITNDSANIESIEYGVGKTNCLVELPNDIKYSFDPANVTFIGTPTFNNGVTSGFSTANYLMTPSINIGTNDFESVYKFKFGEYNSSTGPYQLIARTYNSDYNYAVAVAYDTTNSVYRCHINWGNMTTWSGPINSKATLTVGKDYWVKIERKSGVINLYLSEDGVSYNLDSSKESTEDFGTHQHTLGVLYVNNAIAANQVMYGSIDIANSYVKVAGKTVWKGGTDILTVKKGTKVYASDNESFTTTKDLKYSMHFPSNDVANCYAMIVKTTNGNPNEAIIIISPTDSYLSFQDNKLMYHNTSSETNPIHECYLPFALVSRNKTKSSSVNQIFNGFGYVKNRVFVTPGVKGLISDGWNEDGTYKNIYHLTTKVGFSDIANYNTVGETFGLNYSGTIGYVDKYAESDTQPTTNYTWWHNTKENKLYYKSTGNFNKASSYKIGTFTRTAGTEIPTLSDFKVDAIPTVNDSYPIKEIHQCVGKTNCLTYIPNDIKIDFKPLNVTVVGSPTINRGVASNFNDSNYLTIPKTFNPGSNNWEIVLKITTSDFSVAQDIGGYKDYKLSFYISTAGLATLNVGSGSAWTVTPNFGTLKANTTYWLKAEYKNGVYNAYTSTDGSTFTLGESETSTQIIPSGNINLGDYATGGTNWFKGSIELPNCYIKINDQIWWQGGIGQVTLKKGSKVYKPDGSYQITESDMTSWMTDKTTRFYYIMDNNGLFNTYAVSTTGTAPTTTSGNEVMFNTSNNHIEYYYNGSYVCDCSLPVCLGNNNTTIQTFNGIGFMGSTVFALPGIKGLISNGWNEDGTYKNIQYENKNVLICNGWNNDTNNRYIYIGTYPYSEYNNTLWTNIKTFTYEQPTEPTAQEGNVYWIDTKNNIIKYTNNKGQSWTETKLIAMIGDTVSTNSKITSMSLYPIPTKNNTRIIYKK